MSRPRSFIQLQFATLKTILDNLMAVLEDPGLPAADPAMLKELKFNVSILDDMRHRLPDDVNTEISTALIGNGAPLKRSYSHLECLKLVHTLFSAAVRYAQSPNGDDLKILRDTDDELQHYR